jgi:hypothetical protein
MLQYIMIHIAHENTYPVIGFQVINLLPEQQRPHILAEELDNVQRVCKPGSVFGESEQFHPTGQHLLRLPRLQPSLPVLPGSSPAMYVARPAFLSTALDPMRKRYIRTSLPSPAQPCIPKSPTAEKQLPFALPHRSVSRRHLGAWRSRSRACTP